MLLSASQHDEFERTGLLRLPGAIPEVDAATMCNRVWDYLAEAHGISRTEDASWPDEGGPFGLRAVSKRDEFDRIGSSIVRAALDEVLGKGRWLEPRRWGRLLVTFPSRGHVAWDVPVGAWHNDFVPFQADAGLRAVQMFVLLNEVRPQGGGTLVLSGSHHLVARFTDPADDGPHPRELRRSMASAHPWLRDLWVGGADETGDRKQRFMAEGTVIDGVPVRVVELSGSPGDVFVMHCDTLHRVAPNCLDQPRMMATNMIGREPAPEGQPSS